MLRRHRPRSVYDVLAAIAFFAAVAGGSAYAAANIGAGQIKNDAVRSRHVKDGAVGNGDLGANSVGTGKVINGSLLRGDFRAGQLPPAGARSFDTHLDNGEVRTGPTVNGVLIEWVCDADYPGLETGPNVGLRISPAGSELGEEVFVIGTRTLDGALSVVRDADIEYLAGSGVSADFNVMVRVEPGGKWTSYQLAAGYNPTEGCNFGGLFTPGV